MEKTFKALETLFKVGYSVKDSLKDDGHITIPETIQIGIKAIGLIQVFKDLPEIKVEIKAATPEKINGLKLKLNELFDLPNDELEAMIESGFEALIQLAIMVFLNKPKE